MFFLAKIETYCKYAENTLFLKKLKNRRAQYTVGLYLRFSLCNEDHLESRLE